jgi:hypothetical protein
MLVSVYFSHSIYSYMYLQQCHLDLLQIYRHVEPCLNIFFCPKKNSWRSSYARHNYPIHIRQHMNLNKVLGSSKSIMDIEYLYCF